MTYEGKEYVFVNSDSIVTTVKCVVPPGWYKMWVQQMDAKGDPKWILKLIPKWTPLKLDNFADFNTDHNIIASYMSI